MVVGKCRVSQGPWEGTQCNACSSSVARGITVHGAIMKSLFQIKLLKLEYWAQQTNKQRFSFMLRMNVLH